MYCQNRYNNCWTFKSLNIKIRAEERMSFKSTFITTANNNVFTLYLKLKYV
jgi:hypothetical protein